MKKTITTIIIGLLLLLPLAPAQDNTPADTAQEDSSESCIERTSQEVTTEGESFKFCRKEFNVVSFNMQTGHIRINGKPMDVGDSDIQKGIEITYESFEDGTALLILSKAFEKDLVSQFEKGRFKLLYDDKIETIDATTEDIAEISYGTNKAYVKIMSSTPHSMTFGIDFVNEDGTAIEKIYLPYTLHHNSIIALDLEYAGYYSTAEEPQIFSFELTEDNEVIIITLNEIEYTIGLDKSGTENLIKLSTEEGEITVTAASDAPTTKEIRIGTMLADPESDKTCKYDTDSSLDDFAKRASVQGYYPSHPEIFFDIFTDYCKDESTLVNFGCIGLTDEWAGTSRVTFLEVSCKCAEGACAQGPYCIETDKHAPYEGIYAKGKLKILELGTPIQPYAGYDNGMKGFVEKEFREPLEDTCKGTQLLKEYHCDPDSGSGFSTELVDCPEGTECKNGACLPVLSVLPTPKCTSDADCRNPAKPKCSAGVCAEAAPVTPECTSDADCRNPAKPKCSAGVCAEAAPAGEDLNTLRAELTKLENLIKILETGEYSTPEIPKEGLFDKFEGVFVKFKGLFS